MTDPCPQWCTGCSPGSEDHWASRQSQTLSLVEPEAIDSPAHGRKAWSRPSVSAILQLPRPMAGAAAVPIFPTLEVFADGVPTGHGDVGVAYISMTLEEAERFAEQMLGLIREAWTALANDRLRQVAAS